MGVAEELGEILAHPSETTTRDFKERIDWDSRHARLELARGIVSLANRSGGQLIVGVKDDGLVPVGLPEEGLPDPTEIGKVLAKHFNPPPSFTSQEVSVSGKRFGVIQVAEFARTPHICVSQGDDENGKLVLRQGALYWRTDAMQCSEITSEDALRSLIESAVAKTGASVRAMLGQPAPVASPAPLGPSNESLRFCNLRGSRDTQLGILDLVDRLGAAIVQTRYASVLVPRAIDPRTLEPSRIVREPSRILIEKTATNDGGLLSVVEVSRSLEVRLRESLWEQPNQIEFTSTCAFVFSCLLFAARLYSQEGGTATIEIGLTNPIGRVLIDRPEFSGFWQTYVATSGVDLVVRREVSIDRLTDAAARVELGKEMLTELVSYFGFRPSEAAIAAHLDLVAANIPGLRD